MSFRATIPLLFFTIWFLSEIAHAQEQSSHRAEEANRALRPYTISPETTYFTGPLKADGSIDFIAAVNAHFSQGVTPENNAARIILPLMHVDCWRSQDSRSRVFDYLKLDSPENQESFCFTEQSEFVSDTKLDLENFMEDCTSAQSRRWAPAEFPAVAAWLERNQRVFDTIQDISQERYFVPLYEDTTSGYILASSSYQDDLAFLRRVAWALSIRCNLRMEQGQWNEAWEDILTLKKLAHWTAQSSTWIGAPAYSGISKLANSAAKRLLETSVGNELNWRQLLGSWPVASILKAKEVFGIADRASFLQLICQLGDDPDKTIWLAGIDGYSKYHVTLGMLYRVPSLRCFRLEQIEELTDQERNRQFVERLRELIITDKIDLDQVLRFGNSFYDRAVHAVEGSGYAEQSERWKKVDDEVYAFYAGLVLADRTGVLEDGSINRSQEFSKLLLGILFPSDYEIRRIAELQESRELIELGLAIKLFQSQNKRLPTSIEELRSTRKAGDLRHADTASALFLKPIDQGILIYHRGGNRKDDGGDIDGEISKDWGIRLR